MFVYNTHSVFLRSPERKRGFWYLMCRMVKFVKITCSCFLGAGIPLMVFVCVLGDTADTQNHRGQCSGSAGPAAGMVL